MAVVEEDVNLVMARQEIVNVDIDKIITQEVRINFFSKTCRTVFRLDPLFKILPSIATTLYSCCLFASYWNRKYR